MKMYIVLAILLLLSNLVVADECTFISQRVQCGELTCNRTTHVCGPCRENSDCYEPSVGCFDGDCKLLPLRERLRVTTFVAPVVAFLVCSIAVVAGIGGGGILVPMYVTMLGIPMVNAVALSQATIAGQSLTNVMLLVQRHHPKYQPPSPTRPVINYEYLCLMLPISILGTLLGALCSKISPDWVRIVLLFTLLGYILFRVVKRAMKQRAQDKADAQEKQKLLSEKSRSDSAPDIQPGSLQNNSVPSASTQLLPQYPKRWLGFIVLTFGLLFCSNLFRGPVLGWVKCDSWEFWMIVGIDVVYSLGLSVMVWWYLRGLQDKIEVGDEIPEIVPFIWNKKTTIIFPLVSVLAGAAASMLGIGGGLVLSFLLYEAGLMPEEASATSGLATFLVATEAGLLFALEGLLPWDYAVLGIVSGLFATILGQFGFVRQIKKRGWRFLIISSLGFIIVGSILALTALGVYDTWETVKHHGSLGFGTLCKKGG